MRLRALATALIAMVLLGAAGQATAQAFGSVSSLPTPRQVVPTSAPSSTLLAPEAVPAGPPAFSSAVPAPESAPTVVPAVPVASGGSVPPESPPRPVAFSSVSSGAAATGGGSGPLLPPAGSTDSSSFELAERIVIEKGQRRLLLLRGSDVIASYPVKLGLNPYGHKQREGDFRTPEGTYFLSRRNPHSEFFLSVEVSYPNEADRARAREAGVRPGGLIMIHGQPNVPRKSPDYYANNDWTDGCIAVSNSDMVDIWQRTRLGIPIEIRP